MRAAMNESRNEAMTSESHRFPDDDDRVRIVAVAVATGSVKKGFPPFSPHRQITSRHFLGIHQTPPTTDHPMTTMMPIESVPMPKCTR
jgi:hypothetical protein